MGEYAWVLEQECAASMETDACFICEDERCCDVYQTYLADDQSQAFFMCYRDCINIDGPMCAETCNQMHPGGIDNFAPRWACLQTFCFDETACANEPPDPCATCGNENCAADYVELTARADGFLLWECTRECADAACGDACAQSYPSVAPLLENYFTCTELLCTAECTF